MSVMVTDYDWQRNALLVSSPVVPNYHTPTVEDVLREFADLVRKERIELATVSEDAIAEYAAKLRLAEEEQC